MKNLVAAFALSILSLNVYGATPTSQPEIYRLENIHIDPQSFTLPQSNLITQATLMVDVEGGIVHVSM